MNAKLISAMQDADELSDHYRDYVNQGHVVETCRKELVTVFGDFLHTASATNWNRMLNAMLTYQKSKTNLSTIAYLIHVKEGKQE